jgi:hypothetical protein
MYNTKIDTHPSYGLIQFNRVTGTPQNLFGTNLKVQNFIEFKVLRGERHESDTREDYYGNEILIRGWMSANQFAECITNMNVGHGVPCTLRDIYKVGDLPYPPQQPVRTHKIQEAFEEKMKSFAAKLENSLKQINVILDKTGSINKSDRVELKRTLTDSIMEVKSNIPFMLNEYDEAAQKMVTQAKTEFDSFVTHAAMRIGMEQMTANGLDKIKLLD